MKTLAILSLLVFTLSCNVSKKKEVRECTINGVKRDFSECEKSQNAQTAQKETVRVSINFSIDLQEEFDQLDILDNYYDSNYSTDGRECRAEVYSGTRLELRKYGRSLITRDGSRTVTYTRYGSRDQGYLGGWHVKKVMGSMVRDEYLTLHNNRTATLSVHCHFN